MPHNHIVLGFQHEGEAQAFLSDLRARMREFELALHPDKTRLIRFGRNACLRSIQEFENGVDEKLPRRQNLVEEYRTCPDGPIDTEIGCE